MRRPSILFINRVYPPVAGATGRVLRDLAQVMAREGWQVSVLTTGQKAERARDGGIRVIRVKAPEKPAGMFGYSWIWLKLFIKALRLPKADIVVSLTDPPMFNLAGCTIARLKKSAHIHWCHDLYPDLFPVIGIKMPEFILHWLKRMSRRAMKKCAKVIVIGRCMARHLTYSGVDPKNITVIPNWTEQELDPARGGAADARAQTPQNAASKPFDAQLKEGPKFRVLYAGSLGRAHAFETILEAANLLAHEHPEIEFVFVGEGGGFDQMAAARAHHGLENIRFLPPQPASALRGMMEGGDVHLVSMKEEAGGLLVPCKFYAALAVGRPCILLGPSQCEVAKVIHDFEAGYVVAQGDAQGLAEAIKSLRLSEEAWFSAQNGAVRAGQVFVPHESINAWIERAWSLLPPDITVHHKKSSQ